MKKFFREILIIAFAFILLSSNVYAEENAENTQSVATQAVPEAEENTEPVTYSITGIESEGVKWSGRRTHQNIPVDSKRTYTLYAKTADKDKYTVTGVEIEPADGADYSFYANTGEISITNVRDNISVRALVTKKTTPTNIVVDSISVSDGQNYSEHNLFVQFTVNVKVTDDDGDIVPDTTVYFKDDETEVSYVQARKTNGDGIATFVYSYGIGEEEGGRSSYNSLFALDSGFSGVVTSKEINLVRQYRTDLVLYTNQIISATPNQNDGEAINIPYNYEIWTGEVHQAALVVGSGNWVPPTDGKFTGLSSGQHAIRAREVFDEASATFYFASDYDVFEVPRKRHEDTVKEEPVKEDNDKEDTKVEEQVGNDTNTGEVSTDNKDLEADNTIETKEQPTASQQSLTIEQSSSGGTESISTEHSSSGGGQNTSTEQPATITQQSPVVLQPVATQTANTKKVPHVADGNTQQEVANTVTNESPKKETKKAVSNTKEKTKIEENEVPLAAKETVEDDNDFIWFLPLILIVIVAGTYFVIRNIKNQGKG